MSQDYTLFIYKNNSPVANPVTSQTNTTPSTDTLTFVAGDIVSMRVAFTDGSNLDTDLHTANYGLSMSLGDPAAALPYVTQSKWTLVNDYGFTSSLALTTPTLISALGSETSITPTLQLVVKKKNSAYRWTPMLTKVTVLNPVDS